MTNIVNDISILTTIPDKVLAKFFRKMVFCICEAVQENISDEHNVKDITELDIGIGKLYIKHIGADIKYRFEPSDFFEKALLSTIINKKNYLQEFLDESLRKKFIEAYKDLC